MNKIIFSLIGYTIRYTFLLVVVWPAKLTAITLRDVPPLLARLSRPPWLLPLAVGLIATNRMAWYARDIAIPGVGLSSFLWLMVSFIVVVASYLGFGLGLLMTASRAGLHPTNHQPGVANGEHAAVNAALLAFYPPRFIIHATTLLTLNLWRRVMRSGTLGQAQTRAKSRTLRARGAVVVLGKDTTNHEPIGLTHDELVRHTLVLGATGSGKTTTLRRMLHDSIHHGMGVVIIDLKGDPDLVEEAQQLAHAHNRTCSVFCDTPGQRRDRWNPIELGDPTSRRDKLIGLSEWTEPHYRFICERFAQLSFAAYESMGITPTLNDFVQLLDNPQQLNDIAHMLPREEDRQILSGYLAELLTDKTQLSGLSGFAARIGTLVDPAGALNYTSHGDEPLLNVETALSNQDIVIFSLNSSRGRASAAQLATLAILDVLATVGQRTTTHQSTPAMVLVDEFSAIEGDHILGLLARARSAGIGVTLSTQEIADLTRIDEGFRDQVIGNTATKIIHRQDVPDSAELIARIAGTSEKYKPTFQIDESSVAGLLGNSHTGRGSSRPVEAFLIHPTTIKTLTTGQAIIIRKEPEFTWNIAAIDPPKTSKRRTHNEPRTATPATPQPEPQPDTPQPELETTEVECEAVVPAADESTLMSLLLDDPQPTLATPTLTIVNEPAPAMHDERVWLDVTYAQKNAAKAAGARWDRQVRRWYAPEGITPQLAEWRLPQPIPFNIAREDRTYGSGLYVDLIPETAWGANLRHELTPSVWKQISDAVRARTAYTCEACSTQRIGGKPQMHCHERWHFDEYNHTQTLKRFVCLCIPCHEVTHIGFANTQERGQIARQHLIHVTGMTPKQADDHINEAFARWQEQSTHAWKLDITILQSLNATPKAA